MSVSLCSCDHRGCSSSLTVVPAVAVPVGQGEQVWVIGPPAMARCKMCPSQCHSQATPLEVCVCAGYVSSSSPGCTWLQPQKCLQPQNCQLWEELSPGQELLGAGDSAAMLSEGCRAECRSRARSASSASQSWQQLRSVCSSPGLWPGSPPHARQHVVKSQLHPVAPKRNLCGFMSVKGASAGPGALLTPLTKGAAAPGLPKLPGSGLPCPRSQSSISSREDWCLALWCPWFGPL